MSVRMRAVGAVLGLACVGCSSALLFEPHVIAPYGSFVGSTTTGAGQGRRALPHAGVDFGAERGTPILAAADGVVEFVATRKAGCGTGVLIAHREFSRWTVYCHMERAAVHMEQQVKRGDVIGYVGTSGNAGTAPHVHLELCLSLCPYGHADGNLNGTEDPLSVMAGCAGRAKIGEPGHLVLTYPLPCGL